MNPWNRLLIFLVSMNSLGTLYWHIVKDVSVYWQLGTGGFFLIQELVNILQSRVFSSWTPEKKPISGKSIGTHLSIFQKNMATLSNNSSVGSVGRSYGKIQVSSWKSICSCSHFLLSLFRVPHVIHVNIGWDSGYGRRDGEPEWKIIGVSIGGNA